MEYRLFRIEPPDGFLRLYKFSTYNQIMDDIIKTFAGGKYELKIIDGNKVDSKIFSIIGKPAKRFDCICESIDLFNFGCKCGGL